MAALRKDELVAKRDELEARVREFSETLEASDERMTPEQKEEWNRINGELEDIRENLREREAVEERVKKLDEEGKSEKPAFNVGATRTKNIYDLSSVERSFGDPSVEGSELKDRAKRVLDSAVIPHPGVDPDRAKAHVERLVSKLDSDDGRFSRYLVATDNPAYKRAFPKLLTEGGMAMLTREEQFAIGQVQASARAASLTDASGGFAIPFTLDPSIIPTSNLAVNPFRDIARIENILGDNWNGVSSAGVTASWDAEGAEVSDDAPTLAQPTVSPNKAAVFVPFSIEIGMDWAGLQSEMAVLIQDAKDELEASAFALGTGSGQPLGVISGATATYASATGGAFAVADVYGAENALPPRFRPRASYVMNRAIANRVRQFDTAGGAQLWVDNLEIGLGNGVPTPGRLASRVLGYGAYESSAMSSSVTTGQKILIMGDFSYYLIVDRVGLNLELIPHMFHTSNNRPSGQRGIYAFWRTGATVLSTNAFRVLQL